MTRFSRRHRRDLAPQPVHVVAVQPRRAVDQLLRIDHVRRAALVHEHRDVRVRADDRAGRAGVIEVDVRQQDVAHVVPAHAVLLQAELERGQTRRRPGIDDRDASVGLHDAARDRVRAAEELEIDPRQAVRQNRHWRADYTGGSRVAMSAVDSSAVLTAVARLVAEAPSLRDLVSRLALALRESVPFERLHVLRLDRAESFVLYVVSPDGDVTITGHRIDGESIAIDADDANARSRILCTVRQGTRMHGAVWVSSSQDARLHRRASGAARQRRRPARASPSSTTAIVDRETLRRERIDSLRGLLHTMAESLDIRGRVRRRLRRRPRRPAPRHPGDDLVGRGRRVVPHLRAGRRRGRRPRSARARTRSPATTAHSSSATPTSSATSKPRCRATRCAAASSATSASGRRCASRCRSAARSSARCSSCRGRPTRSSTTTSTSDDGSRTTWRWRCRTSGWPRRRGAMRRRARWRRGSRRRSPR